ncbi:hypothetical protein BHYA_0158g00120 [Botrytis hyacinthi]|uniref:Uncharacterized protein n=1 Tax=Botrytis hyacinthi TaxID=278943 RepID=A0A4Z1GJ20_9HELO|nr:hypothetical protein BHYA_0158g00120 [Botrytis hyacinthi]
MPKTKAALKSAQNVQQKQKQKLKTEQKSKMTTTPVGRNGKPKPIMDNTESKSESDTKTTRDSESNAFTSSIAQPKSTPETPKPTPKRTYPRPVVIWHQNPHRKRRSTTKNLKKDVKSTTDQTPILKQGLNTSSLRRNIQPIANLENIKSTPKVKLTRKSESNGESGPEIATSKKDVGISAPNTAARIVIEISDSDSDSDDDDDDDDDDDFDFDANEVGDSDSDVDEDVDIDEDLNEDDDANTTPLSTSMHSSTLDTTSDMVLTPNMNADLTSPYLGDLNLMPWMPETEPEPAPALDPELGNSEVDTTSNIMELIPDINTAPASLYLGDLDLMPWMPEAEAVSALGLENLLAGNGDVDADANLNTAPNSIQMYTPTLDTTSNIMGSIPDFTAGLASSYGGDLMLSAPEAELELASGLGNTLPGDGALLSDGMYLNMAMDVDMDVDLHLGVDSNMDMDMGMDGYMNVDAYTEINTSPSHTSWKGMCMDPPLIAEEKGWDFSNVGIEEIDGLFEEMKKEMGGDVDVEMGMGE